MQFYKEQIAKHKQTQKQLVKQLWTLSTLRLSVFVVTATGIYFFYTQLPIAGIIGLIGISLFLILVSRYVDVKRNLQLVKSLIKINEEELRIGKRDFLHRPDGYEFQDPSHAYSFDIDLFGRGSLYQYFNRTVIPEGSQQLVHSLTANYTKAITQRQEAIKELSNKAEWRQLYTATASLIKVETPAKTIIKWLEQYNLFVPKIMKWFPWVFGVASILVCVLVFTQQVPFITSFYWLLLGLGITGIYVKRINKLSLHTDKLKDTFRQYALLLEQIEKETFTSSLLQEKQHLIKTEALEASQIFSRLSKHLDALDNRNNIFGAVFGNGFLLWDVYQSYKIEQWIANYQNKVSHWFKVVSFFDAYNSLGNFAFNHPNFVYPAITNNQTTLEVTNIGHPLLDPNKRVDSNLTINNQQFFIVTGANMAGKSTFLRTVSLHIAMANTGLPVCATKSNYTPIKLITSMRTSDSLTDDSSYFFSELSRLKVIVDAIKEGPYFIVLDEILKGTNSTDKAIGSKKFVEKLVGSKATGIIATHDLSLCETANQLAEVENYYFDASIVNNELFFDYKLQPGICQNMNASFLLKKMGIVE
jgi:hypothetical protein